MVVDETDRLLREAYQSWLPTVLRLTRSSDESFYPCASNYLPPAFNSLKTIRRFGVERGFKGKPSPRLMKMVLSATLTQDPSKLAQLDLHHPLFLTTGKRRYQLPEKLESYKLVCESKLKPMYLVALLQNIGEEKSIVFTSSVESTHRLCTLLNFFGDLQIKIKEYSGLQRQSVRSKTLKAFREGEIQVLVSSDAMTRGMDVEGVRNVINYDIPAYIKTYVHRAGRTARAGQSGRCFTLLREDEVFCSLDCLPDWGMFYGNKAKGSESVTNNSDITDIHTHYFGVPNSFDVEGCKSSVPVSTLVFLKSLVHISHHKGLLNNVYLGC